VVTYFIAAPQHSEFFLKKKEILDLDKVAPGFWVIRLVVLVVRLLLTGFPRELDVLEL
jgi:fumarate reductase subunit C